MSLVNLQHLFRSQYPCENILRGYLEEFDGSTSKGSGHTVRTSTSLMDAELASCVAGTEKPFVNLRMGKIFEQCGTNRNLYKNNLFLRSA